MRDRADREAGFIMVDALVGVMIITLMLGIVLTVLNLSGRYSRTASQQGEVLRAAQKLMTAVPREAGDYTGRIDQLAYVAEVREEKSGPQVLCRIRLQLRAAKARHVHRFEGVRWCDRVVTP